MKVKVTLYVRDEIEMPLGKAAAQCAHALNKIFIDRMSFAQDDERVYLQLTPLALAAYVDLDNLDLEIIYASDAQIEELADSPEAKIIDSGKTVFNEPTATVAWRTEGFGDVVPLSERLPFSTDKTPYKQPILVNRSNKSVDDNYVLINCAKMSTRMLLTYFCSWEGVAALDKGDPMLEWLQNGFGKTVVGGKRQSDYDATKQKMKNELSDMCYEKELNKQPSILVYNLISSDIIERYTRHEFSRLLVKL